jgi:hypothetical protein
MTKECVRCGSLIRGCNSRYRKLDGICQVCRTKERRDKSPKPVMFPNIIKGNVGAIGELEVSALLFKKGYQVFRAMSPSSPVDLIILKGKNMIRVEVCVDSTRGIERFPYPKLNKLQDFDLLAVIRHSGIKFYNPNMEEVDVPHAPCEAANAPRIDFEGATYTGGRGVN